MQLSDYGTKNESTRECWIKYKLLQVPDGYTILDAGAGDQHHKEFCNHLNYTSQDFAQYNGQGDKTGLQTGSYNYGQLDIISDIIKLPIKNNCFDVVLCTEVLEHVPDPIAVVKELSRVLKVNGQLILTAPFCSLSHFDPYHFSTGFNIYWYKKYLSEFGLEIIEVVPNGNYFQYLGQELHRVTSIAGRYIKDAYITEVEFNAINSILEMFRRYDTENNQSWELLNFGYQILAKKKE